MKKNFLFAALAAGVLFAACSNENVNEDTTLPGVPATLTVQLEGNGSRGTGTATTIADVNFDQSVRNVTLFFFRAKAGGNAVFDAQPKYIANPTVAGALTAIPVTTALNQVYAIANLGSLPTSVTDLKTLEAYLGDAANGANATQMFNRAGTTSSVYQSGVGTVVVGATPTTLTSTIQLHFVPARIEVKVETDATAWDANNTGNTNTAAVGVTDPYSGQTAPYVALENVVVLGAKAKTHFFTSASTSTSIGSLYAYNATNNPFYAGIANSSYQFWNANTTTKNFYSDVIATKASANNSFFYVFANNPGGAFDQTDKVPTIVTIKGTYYDPTQTTGTPIFYSASFNGTDVNQIIENGKAYTLTLKLNGNPKSGGGGTTDPTNPPTTANVTVTITPAVWTTQGVTKTFN